MNWLKAMDVEEVTQFIVEDVGGGESQPEIMAGIIKDEKKMSRMVRAIEAATGMTLLVDDTPEAIVLSAFEFYLGASLLLAKGN